MRHVDPIEVVLLTPARTHPLAGTLRAIVERVARRPGVHLRERASGEGDVEITRAEVRLVIGLELDAEPGACTLALGLEVGGTSPRGPLWVVPAVAFGRPIDGVERVQRLGSLLAACLDLASTLEGRELMRVDAAFTTPGVTEALAGTAHLSAEALQEALARSLAARAAALLVASLEEGRAWAIDDWGLPSELTPAAIALAVQAGEAPEVLRARALGAAEGLAREVQASVDQALATHGLGALTPLQAAVERLGVCARAALDGHALAPVADALPSDVAVRAAEVRVAGLPRALPGSMLLAFGWAAPSGALAGLALGPSVTTSVAGSGHALFAAAGTAAFMGVAGLARLWAASRARFMRGSLAAARADYQAACATIEVGRAAALGPEIARAALSWFLTFLHRERRRLSAIEAQVRSLGRSVEVGLTAPSADHRSRVSVRGESGREIDVAVDLSAAKKLLDPAPEPLVQRVRNEVAGAWRESLPTLLDLAGAARGLAAKSARNAPWTERSDVAAALVGPLTQALATVAQGLERSVPRGLPVRRMTVLPAPFDAAEVGAASDGVLPCAGDAHLLVLWRPA